MQKWYLNSWFICLMFALSFLIIPFFVGLAFLIMQTTENNKRDIKYKEIDDVRAFREATATECERMRTNTVAECSAEKSKTDSYCSSQIDKLTQRLREMEKDTEELKLIYNPLLTSVLDPYEFSADISSEEYKNKLSLLKVDINEYLKNPICVQLPYGPGTSSKSNIKGNTRQIVRAFNTECALILTNLTVANIDSSREKLQRSYEALNKLYDTDGVKLNKHLLELRLEELNLNYSYLLKKEMEREEQKEIRQQMLEEEKARREIEREKERIEKEEKQFKNEIGKLMKYLQKATEIEKQLYVDKIKELEEKVKLLEKDKTNVLEREQNTRAGYVYVISNIGSFGENVYKIGMTRRLEPMDRVKELGDASVPFEFDVHAMIFSQDAPQLENILHKTFEKNAVNLVNPRKEFYRVSLDEIESVVHDNYNATVTFTEIAKAEQYRESLKLAEQMK